MRSKRARHGAPIAPVHDSFVPSMRSTRGAFHQPHASVGRASGTAIRAAAPPAEVITVPMLRGPQNTDITDLPVDEQRLASQLSSNANVNRKTSDKYDRLWTVFTKFCETRRWNPREFSENLAFFFTVFMMAAISPQGRYICSIDHYFTALNHNFALEKIGDPPHTPWRGDFIAGLKRSFHLTQTQRCAAAGMQCPELRVALSLPLVKLTLGMNILTQVNGNMVTRRRDYGIKVAWFAIFYLMLQYWFRADTLGAMQNSRTADGSNWVRDVVRRHDGGRGFLVRSLKGVKLLHPIWMDLPPALPNSKQRQTAEAIIDAGLAEFDPLTGEPLMGPFLLGGSPDKAATRISSAMVKYITGPSESPVTVVVNGVTVQPISFLPPGTFIASHSWRKTGASANAASPRCNWNSIMKWGGWASAKNAERYVDRKFVHDAITHDFWDWLYTGSFIFHVLPAELLAVPEDDVSIESLRL